MYVQEDAKFQSSDCSAMGEKKKPRIMGWGLRQYSTIVCKKVEAKGRTTYNEVADEILAELPSLVNKGEDIEFDEKNIRRRVYDAFNVLLAIDVIEKDKKEIKWIGFPSTRAEQIKKLEEIRLDLLSRIQKKTAFLQEVGDQLVDLQKLMSRNQKLQKSANISEGVALPFLLVKICLSSHNMAAAKTSPKATVEIEISEDMQFVLFDFNGAPFTLHDDASILKAMRVEQKN
ncbi:transcription factor-like protein DPB isoform X1 [Typha latifolia]|uniref:transcription factor-like protein DPB isoform X1 n=1 Tax=Typha latifolia TaxID=4733 RepID=UPI003C2E4EC5